MKLESLKEKFKHHRFLGKVVENMEKGINYSIFYGIDTYVNDDFFYSHKKGFMNIEATITAFMSDIGLKHIFIITMENGVPIFKQIKGKTEKSGSVKRDDLADIDINPSGKKPDVLDQLTDDMKFKNRLQEITRVFKDSPDYSAGVIFDHFQRLTDSFENTEPNLELIKNSLEEWRHRKQLSFFIIRSPQLGTLTRFGLMEENDCVPSVVKIFSPTLFETAMALACESGKMGKLFLYPLKSANKLLEDKNVATIQSIRRNCRHQYIDGSSQKWTLVENDWSMQDVILPSEVRNKILKTFNDFIDGKNIKKGFIFHGPPGTGKTSIAKALANDGGIYFKKTSASDFKGEYIGQSPKKTRDIFEELKINAPSVLLIDEADSILGERRNTNTDSFQNDIVAEFLANIEGIKDGAPVFTVLSTNNPDLIDSAIRSRLESVEIPLPDNRCLKDLIVKYIGEQYVDEYEKFSGFSGRNIKNIGNAVKYENRDIDTALFEKANEIVTGNMRKLGIDFREGDHGFDDIYGYEKIKKRIKRYIKKGKKKFILYGPSGTGKTSFTKAVANYENAYYVPVSAKDIAEGRYNLKQIEQSLHLFLNLKKIVINIDEIDSIAVSSPSVLRSDFLPCLESLEHPNIILTATTNFFEKMDSTVQRRFEQHIEVGLPDKNVFISLIDKEYSELVEKKEALAERFESSHYNIDKAKMELEDILDEMEDIC